MKHFLVLVLDDGRTQLLALGEVYTMHKSLEETMCNSCTPSLASADKGDKGELNGLKTTKIQEN